MLSSRHDKVAVLMRSQQLWLLAQDPSQSTRQCGWGSGSQSTCQRGQGSWGQSTCQRGQGSWGLAGDGCWERQEPYFLRGVAIFPQRCTLPKVRWVAPPKSRQVATFLFKKERRTQRQKRIRWGNLTSVRKGRWADMTKIHCPCLKLSKNKF